MSRFLLGGANFSLSDTEPDQRIIQRLLPSGQNREQRRTALVGIEPGFNQPSHQVERRKASASGRNVALAYKRLVHGLKSQRLQARSCIGVCRCLAAEQPSRWRMKAPAQMAPIRWCLGSSSNDGRKSGSASAAGIPSLPLANNTASALLASESGPCTGTGRPCAERTTVLELIFERASPRCCGLRCPTSGIGRCQ